MTTTEIGRIVEQLEQVHEGQAWHGPSVGESLADVSATTAARRPIGEAHSIWELVHHLRVTDALVRAHVTGETAVEEPEWPSLTDTGDRAWRATLEALKATQASLRDAVARFPVGRLHETIPGKTHSFWYEMMGILHHDLYHAGQISLLKKAV
jgi:DinB family protein